MSQELGGHLEALERELLGPTTRGDRLRLKSLLAVEFREFGSSGRSFTRDAIITELLGESLQPVVMLSEFSCYQVTESVALVTYKTERQEITEQMDEAHLAGTRRMRALRSS